MEKFLTATVLSGLAWDAFNFYIEKANDFVLKTHIKHQLQGYNASDEEMSAIEKTIVEAPRDVKEKEFKEYFSKHQNIQNLIKAKTIIYGDVKGVVNAEKGSKIYQTINTFSHLTPKLLTKGLGSSGKNFFGRESDIENIDVALNQAHAVVLLNGIGGIGKSSLASKYLVRKKELFDYYGFIEVSSDIKSTFFSELKDSLNLETEKSDEAFGEALNKLHNLEGKKLLIIDDVKDTTSQQKEIEAIVGLANSGFMILFASRVKIGDIKNYHLNTLAPKHARELFLSYHKTTQIEKVDKILKYLDYHTLFVELVAKMIKNTDYNLDAIIKKFEKGELSKIELIDEENGDGTTLNKNLQELFSMQNLSENYILLLKKLSMLPSIEIDTAFLKQFFDDEKIVRKLNFLESRGWLIKTNQNYKLHQIIKEYILSTHTPIFEEIEKQIDFFDNLISASENAQTAIDIKDKLHYYESTIKVLDILKSKNETIAAFLGNLGNIYYHLGEYEKALPLFKNFLKIREEVLGKNHPNTAASYNNLAVLYESMGEYEKALPLSKNSLKISEEVLGKNHSNTAASYNNLAGFYRSMEEYEKALPLYKNSLKIREEVLGKNHPSTASSYNNLAGLYRSMGEYEKALPLYKDSLKIYEKVLGKNHPDTATSYNNLAIFYFNTKGYKRAYDYIRKAVNVWEKVLPTNHPHLISSKQNLKVIEKEL